jgi:hypothetical protein
MKRKINLFREDLIDSRKISEIFQGWKAYADWANSYKLINETKREIIDIIWEKTKRHNQ